MRALDLPELLASLNRPAAQLVVTSRGLRLRRPYLADDRLQQGVSRHAGALRIAHQLDRIDPLSSPSRCRAWRVADWGAVTALHARWMAHLFQAPAGPVVLRPGVRVVDWDRFRTATAQRYAAGPAGPYADALRLDLAALFERFAAPRALTAPDVPAFARAA